MPGCNLFDVDLRTTAFQCLDQLTTFDYLAARADDCGSTTCLLREWNQVVLVSSGAVQGDNRYTALIWTRRFEIFVDKSI